MSVILLLLICFFINRGFARQPCCTRKNFFFHRKKNLLFMAAVSLFGDIQSHAHDSNLKYSSKNVFIHLTVYKQHKKIISVRQEPITRGEKLPY